MYTPQKIAKIAELSLGGAPLSATIGSVDTVYPTKIKKVRICKTRKCVGGRALLSLARRLDLLTAAPCLLVRRLVLGGSRGWMRGAILLV